MCPLSSTITKQYLHITLILPADMQRPGDVRWRSPKGSRRPRTTGEFQEMRIPRDQYKNWLFNEKIGFWKQKSLYYISNPVFYWENKYSKVLNGTSWRPNDEIFPWLSHDVGQTCFLNSTHKHIKLAWPAT